MATLTLNAHFVADAMSRYPFAIGNTHFTDGRQIHFLGNNLPKVTELVCSQN